MIDACPKGHGLYTGPYCPTCGPDKPEPPGKAVVAGQDLAKYRDYATYISLGIIDKVARLERVFIWPHTDYSIVAADTKAFYIEDHCRLLGVDRGNAAEPVLEQYAKMGLRVEPVQFSLATKNDMVNFTRNLLQRKIAGTPPYLALPRSDAGLVGELKRQIKEQERIIGAAELPRFDHPEGRHDDLFWALCIACWMARQELTNPAWAIRAG